MKKRAKIITTVASLCLAVALMAFGVYAARTATLNVTSSVSFVAQDVKVHWTIGVVKGTGADATTVVDPAQSENTYNLNTVAAEGQATESLTANLENVEFDLAHRVIVYTFTCTNESEKQSIDIAVTATSQFEDEANVLAVTYRQGLSGSVSGSVADNASDEWTGVTVAPLGVYVYEVKVELLDIASDIASADQTLTVAFAATKHVANP